MGSFLTCCRKSCSCLWIISATSRNLPWPVSPVAGDPFTDSTALATVCLHLSQCSYCSQQPLPPWLPSIARNMTWSLFPKLYFSLTDTQYGNQAAPPMFVWCLTEWSRTKVRPNSTERLALSCLMLLIDELSAWLSDPWCFSKESSTRILCALAISPWEWGWLFFHAIKLMNSRRTEIGNVSKVIKEATLEASYGSQATCLLK